MGEWSPSSRLAKVVYAAGFVYDPAQDIIVSRLDPYQRYAGYNWLYDVASPALHMIIDCEPFYFDFGGHAWLVELWKGQYGLECGGEIGLYRDRHPVDQRRAMPRTRHYDCPPTDFGLPQMQFTLHKSDRGGDDKLLLQRGPEKHWWLTGFRWGEFASHTHDLTMKLEITFQADQLPFSTCVDRGAGRGLRDAFLESVKARGYGVSTQGALGLAFTFDRPRSQQPASRIQLEPSMQRKNGELVAAYNALRQALGIPNNDPNAFDQLDGRTDDAIPSLKEAAAKVRERVSPPAARPAARSLAGARPGARLPAGGKVQAAKAAVAGKARDLAEAVAGKLRDELPAGAKAAYDTLFAFHDRKLWHVQAVAREA